MSDNTDLGNESPEDNKLIRGLRTQIDDLTAAVKTAGDDAIAKVKRSKDASSLMPAGFEGLSDVFEAEVDGDLDAASAAKWLAGRGFSASSDEIAKQEAAKALALEEVTDLGGAVAAAGNLTPEDTATKLLGEVGEDVGFKSIEDVSAAVDAILNG